MFVTLVVVACFGTTALADTQNGATSLNGVPSIISSDRDPYTCTGNACEHIELVTCTRSHAKWKCDTIHKKTAMVFKPQVSCNSKGVKGVSCGVAVHTELKTPSTAETIVGGVVTVFLCLLFGPTICGAVLLGALLGGDRDGYTSTSYDDC